MVVGEVGASGRLMFLTSGALNLEFVSVGLAN